MPSNEPSRRSRDLTEHARPAGLRETLPADSIEFFDCHQPSLRDGDYVLTVRQQVKYQYIAKDQAEIEPRDPQSPAPVSDGAHYGWSSAPGATLQFSVAGPRFTLDPGEIYSQFPPPKSIGEYYKVLPHVVFNRTTLAWERTIDNSAPSEVPNPVPWMALLLFDATADGGAPEVSILTVQDLLDTYGQSATPGGQPEFVKILPRDSQEEPGAGELKLEVGQHVDDRLTVIDVPKQLLWEILPGEEDLPLLAHVRAGQAPMNPSQTAQYPVIFCNRLPAPGTVGDTIVGSQSTVHLVSLESRKPLLDALKTQPGDDNLVRFVSLASWSFSTLQQNNTFSVLLKEAWCPDADRSDQTTSSTCAGDALHTLRMPVSTNTDAERFLSQGYVPINHQTRQGNHLVSWYRSPLLPGPNSAADVALPVRASDQLLRYVSDVGMFDATYAAAWELGRTLTLRSKVAVSLFNWKRAHAQQSQQAEEAASHLPFAPDYSIAPDFPADVGDWFSELLSLEHIPFHYLVPREEMLPVNSLRFFTVDARWIECLLDGAFSIGRVVSADVSRDASQRDAAIDPTAHTYSGFILRSPVVSGWPDLGIEAYGEALLDEESEAQASLLLRMDRLTSDILICIFQDDIQTVDIHEHPEAIHFGVDTDDHGDVSTYSKSLRSPENPRSAIDVQPLPWKQDSDEKRTLDIARLAQMAGATNSAVFGFAMIEGVEKVRFIRRQ